MSDDARNLVERAEAETGVRIDDPDNPAAYALLLGALAREIGKTPKTYKPKDDCATGLLIMGEVTNGEARQQFDEMIRAMLLAGVSLDELKFFFP